MTLVGYSQTCDLVIMSSQKVLIVWVAKVTNYDTASCNQNIVLSVWVKVNTADDFTGEPNRMV